MTGWSLLRFAAVAAAACVAAVGAHPSATAAQLLPKPTLTAVQPSTVPVASPSLAPIEVRGRDFAPGAVVRINGSDRATVFSSPTALLVTLNAGDVASSRNLRITARNVTTAESNVLTLQVVNPVPQILTLGIQSATVSLPDLPATLGDTHVNGSGFVPESKVLVDGQPRSTSFQNPQLVVFSLNNADVASAGVRRITVLNPEPGGGGSNGVDLPVNYPPVRLTGLNPTSVEPGTQDGLEVELSGDYFHPLSEVFVGGVKRTPQEISWNRITVRIPADAVATPGQLPIYVKNPAPGGGTSETQNLDVVSPPAPVLGVTVNGVAVAHNATVDLGSVAVGVAHSVTTRLENLGNATLTITRPTVIGPAASDYSIGLISAAIGSTGAAVSSQIKVTPSAAGELSAEIHIPNNSAQNPFIIKVTATGTLPDNPHPEITSLEPNPVVRPQTSSVPMRVVGLGFVETSSVLWQGVERPATYVSPTQLQFDLPASTLESGQSLGIWVRNPEPGGGTSNGKSLLVRNAVPSITSVNPASLESRGNVQTLRVTGSGFVRPANNFGPGSVVRWNGQERQTTVLSPTELEVELDRVADLGAPSTGLLTVFNSSPGGGSSSEVPVEVTAVELEVLNPLPRLDNVEPQRLAAGTAGASLRVLGDGFVRAPQGTVARWNGHDRPVTWLSANELRVELSAQDLASPGTGRLSLFNPGPGGGSSSDASLEIQGVANPTPVLEGVEVAPAQGIPGLALVVRGTGFAAASVVQWNGRQLETTFDSEGQLRARVPPGFINPPRRGDTFTVTVMNPGGGTSQGVQVTVDR